MVSKIAAAILLIISIIGAAMNLNIITERHETRTTAETTK